MVRIWKTTPPLCVNKNHGKGKSKRKMCCCFFSTWNERMQCKIFERMMLSTNCDDKLFERARSHTRTSWLYDSIIFNLADEETKSIKSINGLYIICVKDVVETGTKRFSAGDYSFDATSTEPHDRAHWMRSDTTRCPNPKWMNVTYFGKFNIMLFRAQMLISAPCVTYTCIMLAVHYINNNPYCAWKIIRAV